MVKHSNHTAFSVLNWQLYIHFALASLRIMSHWSRSNLVFLEVNWNPLGHTQDLQVVYNILVCFFLVQLPSFCFQIRWFRSVFTKKRIQNLLSNRKELTVWLIKLFQELQSDLRVLVFKLRVNFKSTFEKSLVTLLQVLREGIVQSLQLQSVFLCFFRFSCFLELFCEILACTAIRLNSLALRRSLFHQVNCLFWHF